MKNTVIIYEMHHETKQQIYIKKNIKTHSSVNAEWMIDKKR